MKFYNGGMGRASTTTARWAQLEEGRRKKTRRYLGPLLSNDLSLKDERRSRINAIRRGFLSMGKFWTSKARFSTKRFVFISKVWVAATSAIESLL